jgi:hypothetical protein
MIKRIFLLRNHFIFFFYDFLSKVSSSQIKVNPHSDFIVCIASYPKRDHLLPAVFQALSKQTCSPKRFVLVLSVEEYDVNKLPKHIERLQNKGVEIIWSVNNPFAVKTLVPVLVKYPKENLVALDDDFIYYKNILQRLYHHALKNPGAIIGLTGKELYRKGSEINMYFRRERLADITTPSSSIYFLKGSGTFYPAGSIHSKAVDISKIHEFVPGRGADMWFWAAAHAQGSTQICIGDLEKYDVGIPIPENNQTKTRELPTHEAMNERFQRVIDYYNIRQKLLKELPDITLDLNS